MIKRIVIILYRFAPMANRIRRIVKFLQDNPGIMDALQEMSLLEAMSFVLFIGYLVYLWDSLLSERFPRIYFILKKTSSLMLSDV